MSTDSSVVQIQKPKILKECVPKLYSIGNDLFNICYVQPDPLPHYIASLQKLHIKGLEFVKIPINSKEDRLYVRSVLVRLMRIPGTPTHYIDTCITDYNQYQIEDNRNRLLRLMQFTFDYFDFIDTEFLVDSID